MSPLPAADTSSQTSHRGAPLDVPTSRSDALAEGPGKKATTLARKPRSASKSAVQRSATGSLDNALGSAPQQFTTRTPEAVYELLKERAALIAETLPNELRMGGPGGGLRLVITDAIVRALELDAEAHADRVRETRARELVAQTRARVG